MAKGYLIDTNIFTLYTQGELSEKGNVLMDSIFNDSGCQISVITRMELLSWNTDEETTHLINEFTQLSKEFGLTEEIIIKTGEMRRSKKIKLPDAVIATTAMVNDLILVSDNDRDFGKIENLRYVNPRKL